MAYDDWLIVDCSDPDCDLDKGIPNPIIDGDENNVELDRGWLYLDGSYYCSRHRPTVRS